MSLFEVTRAVNVRDAKGHLGLMIDEDNGAVLGSVEFVIVVWHMNFLSLVCLCARNIESHPWPQAQSTRFSTTFYSHCNGEFVVPNIASLSSVVDIMT